MIKRTVPTPIAINAIFLLLLLLPVIFISIGRASASPVDCKKEFYNGFFQEITPELKKQCGKKFEYFTRWEIKRMNNFATFNLNK